MILAGCRRAGVVLVLIALSACDGAGSPYFPLAPGTLREYVITRTTMDGTRAQRHVLRDLEPAWLSGRRVIPRISLGGDVYYYGSGDGYVLRVATRMRTQHAAREHLPAVRVLPIAPVTGATWSAATMTTVLEKTGPPQETLYRINVDVVMTYTVTAVDARMDIAAGSYTDCVLVTGHGEASADVGNYIGRATFSVESRDWYAPGVGLVRSERQERTSSEALPGGRMVVELRALRR